MSRRFIVPLAGVLLFSFLALGIGPAPVIASAVVYDFTATSHDPIFGSFSLKYTDWIGDALLTTLDEVVPGSFSGVWVNYSYPDAPVFYTDLCIGVPHYVGPWTPFDGTLNGWFFGFGGIANEGPDGGAVWTYSESPSPAPIPPSVFLLGAGLFGLAGWRRFRKSCP